MKNYNFLLVLLISLTLINCRDDDDPMTGTGGSGEMEMEEEMEMLDDLAINIIFPNYIHQEQLVIFDFESTSGNADSFEWEFEDGSPSSSTETNPSVVFDSFGVKRVSLTAFRSADGASITQELEVNVYPGMELLVHYPLDGNAEDIGGNNFNGIVTGAVATENSKGETDAAMEFDGDDYITTSDQIDDNLGDGVSFSVWVNVKKAGEWNRVISNYSGDGTGGDCVGRIGFAVSTTDEEGMRFTYSTDGNDYIGRITAPNSISLNQWHHVVATWNGDRNSDGFEIYIDGERSDVENLETGGVCTEYLESTTPFEFGRAFCAAGDCAYFTGSIDDVRIYNRLIDVDEILFLGN